MLTPLELLQWLLQNATQVIIRQGDSAREHKNKVVLQYVNQDGVIDAVGSPTISAAVCKAMTLIEAENRRRYLESQKSKLESQ